MNRNGHVVAPLLGHFTYIDQYTAKTGEIKVLPVPVSAHISP